MAFELTNTTTLNFLKDNANFSATQNSKIDVAGENAIKATEIVGPTDAALDLGHVSTIGFAVIRNLALGGVPAAPVLSFVMHGTPGSTTNKYRVVAHFLDGSLSVSDELTIATCNATLDGTNYPEIDWTDVGAATYDIIRTSAGGTPSTTGFIHTGSTGSSYNDQGAAGDGSPVPDTIESDMIVGFAPTAGSVLADYWLTLKAGEANLVRLNSAAVHRMAFGGYTEIEYTIIED